MIKKHKSPYIRDLYLAYLIDGAKRTETDGFAKIEKWMIADKPPEEIHQWDRRYDVVDAQKLQCLFIATIIHLLQY